MIPIILTIFIFILIIVEIIIENDEKKIEEKRKKERIKELERMFEEFNTDNLGDYSFGELRNKIIDLKEFINILKKK